MYAQTRLLVSLLIANIGIAACSPNDDTSLVSEARASSTPSQFDYGWRTSESPSAERDGTVFEYQ
jgi:hypothetical protein